MDSTKEKNSVIHNILSVIGAVMCVILIPILIINCTLLIKGYTNKDAVPTIGGVAPMIVLTDSMVPTFNGGDLILIRTMEPEDVQAQDIIAFFDPMGSGTSVVTHRVLEVVEENGQPAFRTKGDGNLSEDTVLVPGMNLIGEYTGLRIPEAGHVAMFMQTTTGFLVCVFLPMVMLVGYDVLRRQAYDKKHAKDKDALMAELEELRRMKAEMGSKREE